VEGKAPAEPNAGEKRLSGSIALPFLLSPSQLSLLFRAFEEIAFKEIVPASSQRGSSHYP
jgi:hypothetical protein